MKISLGINYLLVSLLGLCRALIWQIPLPKDIQSCYNQVRHADIQTYVGSTFSWLCESAVKKSHASEPPQFDVKKASYYKHLYEKCASKTSDPAGKVRSSRQAGLPPCIRKEYRKLTDDERRRFHHAVNALKQDTSIEPNKYDAIAFLHEMAAFVAHGGAGFLGWHRTYILMFETALREVDPSVCLPYWDSSLDNELDDPSQSPIWTPEFFGNSQGPVVHGPFANWTTPEGVQLIRNVGADGELFSATAIADILSRSKHEDIITSPQTEPRFDLEVHHAGVHLFCGGTMGQLHTAAFDPIFFLVHAFVDYIWELFRTNLRAAGIDPERYPDVSLESSRHHGNAATGLGQLTQADAYKSILADSYKYEPVSSCDFQTSTCGSRHLACMEGTGRCVPVFPDSDESPKPTPPASPYSTPIPNSPPRPLPSHNATTCPPSHMKTYGKPIQNDYCCDRKCDTNEWAMIPVKIINVRPPKFSTYQSYPVHNGKVDDRDDIYSPNAYSQIKRYTTQRQSNPKTYKRCAGDESIGQVFLSSWGINYEGYYKEAAFIDQRLAVSISMGFVAVKKPSPGKVSEAIVRANDACGRVCHAACKDPITGNYKNCMGAIAVSSEQPLMYGSTYDEAVLKVFDYEFNNDCPKFKTDSFFVTFYCDYHNEFPYAEHSHDPPPPLPAVTSTTTVQPAQTTGCEVSPQCVLDVPCPSERSQCNHFNEKQACRGSCQAYALCTYGRYFLRICPAGQYFDDNLKICLPGQCSGSDGYKPSQQGMIGGPMSVGKRISNRRNSKTSRKNYNSLLTRVIGQLVG